MLRADHLYTLNLLDMVDTHLEKDADPTMVTTLVDEDASRCSGLPTDGAGRVTGCAHEPARPEGRPAAAEIFRYDARALLEPLGLLPERQEELEAYGDDLLPCFVAHRLEAHRLGAHWTDRGAPQAYWTDRAPAGA